jgi:hypothetical protein
MAAETGRPHRSLPGSRRDLPSLLRRVRRSGCWAARRDSTRSAVRSNGSLVSAPAPRSPGTALGGPARTHWRDRPGSLRWVAGWRRCWRFRASLTWIRTTSTRCAGTSSSGTSGFSSGVVSWPSARTEPAAAASFALRAAHGFGDHEPMTSARGSSDPESILSTGHRSAHACTTSMRTAASTSSSREASRSRRRRGP